MEKAQANSNNYTVKNREQFPDYFLGLDIGTGSVGWSVTDEMNRVLRFNNRNTWGVRLFETAQTNKERRTARNSRRRYHRKRERTLWLQELLRDEINKIDPTTFDSNGNVQRIGFLDRMETSFLHNSKIDDNGNITEENTTKGTFLDSEMKNRRNIKRDYNIVKTNKNSLFNDDDYKDKDYFADFPTIWHLRYFLMTGQYCNTNTNKSNQPKGKIDIRHYYLAINHILKHRGHFLFESENSSSNLNNSKFTPKTDKIIELSKELTQDKYNEHYDNEKEKKKAKNEYRTANITDLQKDKISNDKEDIECDEFKVTNGVQLCKLIFDGSKTIDGIKIEFLKWNEIEDQVLAILPKEVFEVVQEAYFYYLELRTNYLLRDHNDLESFYIERYKEYTNGEWYKNSLEQEFSKIDEKIKKETDEKKIKKLEEEKRNFKPPRMRTEPFPMTFNHNSLTSILNNSTLDKEIQEKILQIHKFRIPYYIGPLNNHSNHSWVIFKDENRLVKKGDKEIRPWNIEQIVDFDKTKEAFYKSLISKCTFLPSEDVIAKDTILNQKYLVLEQLNNAKINGRRLEQDQKLQFFNSFKREKQTKTTPNKLLKKLEIEGKLSIGNETDTNKTPFIHQMSSFIAFSRIFGEAFVNSNQDKIDEFIKFRTMDMSVDESLKRSELDVDNEQKEILAKLSFSGWSRYSKNFLDFVTVDDDPNNTVINCLENSTNNIMELMSENFLLLSNIDKFNGEKIQKSTDILNERWFNPIAKRPILQTLKIIKELEQTFGKLPKEIFIESTRDLYTEKSKKGKETTTRIKELEDKGIDISNINGYIKDKEFLWLLQDKQCIYCEESIILEEVEVDHIIPQAKLYDDSLRNNKVAACHKCNNDKSDTYPLVGTYYWRLDLWKKLYDNKRINKIKFQHLTAKTFEPGGFLPFQLVATGQIGVTLKNVLLLEYQNLTKEERPKIRFIKPHLSKILRKEYSKTEDGKEHKDRTIIKQEFVKCRTANNFHHANDAYLATVVGRTYYYTIGKSYFSKNGEKVYVKNYSKLFYPESTVGNDKIWSIEHFNNLVKWMKKNKSSQFCITYQPKWGDGALFDATLYSTNKTNLIMQKKGLKTNLYGGFSSVKTFGYGKDENANLFSFSTQENPKKSLPLNIPIRLNDRYLRMASSSLVDSFQYKGDCNFTFSHEQYKLINQITSFIDNCKKSKSKLKDPSTFTDNLLEKFNKFQFEKFRKLIKDIIRQIPLSHHEDINIEISNINNVIDSLILLQELLKYIEQQPRDLKLPNGTYIYSKGKRAMIQDIKLRNESITGLWQKRDK